MSNGKRPRKVVFLVLLLSGCRSIHRDQREIVSIADPKFLEDYAATRRFSAGHPNSIKIVPDGSAVLFLRSGPRDNLQNLYEFDTKTGQEREILTAEAVLKGAEEKLSAEEKARRERARITTRGIAGYQLTEDGSKILVPLSGRLFVIDRASRDVKELASDKGFPLDARFSPDGKSVSCVRDGNLFVMEIASGEERQLTSGANENISFGTAEFVAQEEMDRREGYWWSPDSEQILYQRTDTTGVETMHIMDAKYPERPPQTWAYPRPGMKNADVQIGLIPASGGETKWIEWNREKYPYVATIRWKDGPPFLLVQNRKQTEEVLYQIDPISGKLTQLLSERDDAWLTIEQVMPRWIMQGKAFLWLTERNGAMQLQLHSLVDGDFVNETETDFGLKEFLHLGRNAYFVQASDEPTKSHVHRIPFGLQIGKRPADSRLSHEDGVHSAVFADQSEVFVLSSNASDGRRHNIVYDAKGHEIGRLRSVAQEPPFVPNFEITTIGPLQFRAAIIRPRNFNPKMRYPVIDSVYGGPHSQTVHAARSYLFEQWIADHGFIVVSIDGRGTSSRRRDWERIVKGDLMAIPLVDQVAGLKALGEKYHEMDMSRVGIYGWSFGGYFSAMAVMRRPDVFKVAVAGAPVCDWRDYDTHYTERYMGLPDENPAGYDAASVLTYCPDLKRPLLIIHGTADDNVYFMHTLKMSDALFRAGRDHELLPLSDFTHLVSDPLVTRRLYERIMSFMEEHLGK